jgi:hypothetical protein
VLPVRVALLRAAPRLHGLRWRLTRACDATGRTATEGIIFRWAFGASYKARYSGTSAPMKVASCTFPVRSSCMRVPVHLFDYVTPMATGAL